MPYRKVPLVNDCVYHVYNQGIERRVVFPHRRQYQRFLVGLKFYRHKQGFTRLANYLAKSSVQLEVFQQVMASPQLVEVVAYTLMPNHFHLVVKQLIDGGISSYLADVQNSYTKYFNARHRRRGSLFLSPFKAVRLETDEQLLHVVRYVHLNPYTSGLTRNIEEMIDYPYSSMGEYVGRVPASGILDELMIRGYFKDYQHMLQFVTDQAEYQRTMDAIKHLTIEEEMSYPGFRSETMKPDEVNLGEY